MNPLLQKIDFRKWAVIALLVLWASATFSIALMEISFVVALVLWILSIVKSRVQTSGSVQRRAFSKIEWLLWGSLTLFFLCVLASFFTSEYFKQSFRGIFKIAKPILALLMCADLFRDDKNRKQFGLAFLLTFLLVTVDCSIQYAFGKSLLRGFPAQDSSAGLRLVGPFGDFGRMSAFLILVIPVFALRAWAELRLNKRFKDAVFAFLLAATGFLLLYLTRCRAPVLALVVSFAALLIYKRWFKTLGIGLICFLALLAVTPRGMIIHLDAESKEQSIVERVELWKRALDVIKAKPWLGTGINTYNVAHEKYDTNQNWRVRGYYAHNGYLQLAAEIGVPGISFFLLFLLIFFIKGLRGSNSVRGSPDELLHLGILTGLLAFLIYGLFDTNLQSPQCLMSFWLLAGVLIARQAPKPLTTGAVEQ